MQNAFSFCLVCGHAASKVDETTKTVCESDNQAMTILSLSISCSTLLNSLSPSEKMMARITNQMMKKKKTNKLFNKQKKNNREKNSTQT